MVHWWERSKGFSLGTPVFLPPQKPTFLNSNSIWDLRATGLSVARLLSDTLVKQSRFIYFVYKPILKNFFLKFIAGFTRVVALCHNNYVAGKLKKIDPEANYNSLRLLQIWALLKQQLHQNTGSYWPLTKAVRWNLVAAEYQPRSTESWMWQGYWGDCVTWPRVMCSFVWAWPGQ